MNRNIDVDGRLRVYEGEIPRNSRGVGDVREGGRKVGESDKE